MFKKLRILIIISILEVTKLLISNQHMHNLYAIFVKKQKDCLSGLSERLVLLQSCNILTRLITTPLEELSMH